MFSLIGTTYGGDGTDWFGLPDMRGLSPMGIGTPPGSPNTYALGVPVGQDMVALNDMQMPPHTHTVSVATTPATTTIPGPSVVQGAVPTGNYFYGVAGEAGVQTLAEGTVGLSWGGEPHENRQPSLVLQYAICVNGVYPPFEG